MSEFRKESPVAVKFGLDDIVDRFTFSITVVCLVFFVRMSLFEITLRIWCE